MNSHSAVPGLNRDQVYSIFVRIPLFQNKKPLPKYCSDLDDKIGLNNEMNKTLEEIGQALFKRWFIDFEFLNENGNPYRSLLEERWFFQKSLEKRFLKGGK